MNDSVAGGKWHLRALRHNITMTITLAALEMNDGWFRKRDDVEIHLYVSSAPWFSESELGKLVELLSTRDT